MLGGYLSPQHGESYCFNWRNGLQLWRVVAYVGKADKRQGLVLQLGGWEWG
jgi:hypothetical protein